MRALALSLCLVFLGAACTAVKPWERAALADRRMQWVPAPGRAAGKLHVLTIREGAKGGHGSAGGACGCN